jgi:hypothetical protein
VHLKATLSLVADEGTEKERIGFGEEVLELEARPVRVSGLGVPVQQVRADPVNRLGLKRKEGREGLLLLRRRLDVTDGLLGRVPAVALGRVAGAAQPARERAQVQGGLVPRGDAGGAAEALGPGGHKLRLWWRGGTCRSVFRSHRRLEVLPHAGQAPRQVVWGQASAGLKLIPPHANRGAVEGNVASGLLAGILAKGTFDGRARLLVEDGLVGAHRDTEDLSVAVSGGAPGEGAVGGWV